MKNKTISSTINPRSTGAKTKKAYRKPRRYAMNLNEFGIRKTSCSTRTPNLVERCCDLIR